MSLSSLPRTPTTTVRMPSRNVDVPNNTACRWRRPGTRRNSSGNWQRTRVTSATSNSSITASANRTFQIKMLLILIAGLNLAVVSGLGLIVGALGLALVYAWFCRNPAGAPP